MMRLVYLLVCCILMLANAQPDEFVPKVRWKGGLAQTQDNPLADIIPIQPLAPAPATPETLDATGAIDTTGALAQDNTRTSDVIIQGIEDGISIEDIIEPPMSYRYSSFYKRDPFSYPKREEVDEEIIVNKLQLYDVSSLDVVGIWWLSTGVAKALIITPPGEGIIVSVGDYVGNNNGEVINITDNNVVIREYQMSPDGTRQFSDSVIPLDESFDTGNTNLKEKSSASDTSIEADLKKAIENITNPAANKDSTAPAPASALPVAPAVAVPSSDKQPMVLDNK
ncbi:MAG: pilus assembly protein PilP [Pseudomonadota bacterium]|nr:pilus assembly protein PilP [Pseudomonadota bacterium]